MNAPFIIESWQFLASWLILRRNTRGNLRSPTQFGNNAPATIPVDFDVPGAVDLHQYEAVFEFRKKAQRFQPCHQFARGREDN
jgi:hypothetical protein